jgi:hypothetical protein
MTKRPPRFQCSEHLLQHRLILLEVMVHIQHQDRSERVSRESGAADVAFYDFHITQIVCRHSVMQPLDGVIGNIFCEHFSRRPHQIGHPLSIVTVSRSDIYNPVSLGYGQRFQYIS